MFHVFYLSVFGYSRGRKVLKKMSETICYCFNYTTNDIRKDIDKNGKSTIMEKIKSEKKRGGCQCKTMNPKGV